VRLALCAMADHPTSRSPPHAFNGGRSTLWVLILYSRVLCELCFVRGPLAFSQSPLPLRVLHSSITDTSRTSVRRRLPARRLQAMEPLQVVPRESAAETAWWESWEMAMPPAQRDSAQRRRRVSTERTKRTEAGSWGDTTPHLARVALVVLQAAPATRRLARAGVVPGLPAVAAQPHLYKGGRSSLVDSKGLLVGQYHSLRPGHAAYTRIWGGKPRRLLPPLTLQCDWEWPSCPHRSHG
jgi:hypothetical protein